MKKFVKTGDRMIVVGRGGIELEVKNRVPSEEAKFAMDLILASVNSDKPSGAVVERAFDIARLTFAHIKSNRMDTPFPFAKVYGDVNK